MPYFRSSTDGALLHYVDYAPLAAPVTPSSLTRTTADSKRDFSDRNDVTLVFIHGWPMSHRMYEHLLLRLCETHGVRCVASDRRGFGGSEWSGNGKDVKGDRDGNGGITYQTFAQDTIDLLESVRDVGAFYFVAASMGCGETLLAYLSMNEALQNNCQGFVWLGPSLPFPLQTEANPTAPSQELWHSILAGVREDRVGFARTALPGVFGVPFDIGVEVPATVLERFEGIVNQADALAVERCVKIITSKDFTEELKRLDGEVGVRVLVIHGGSDQGMPAEASALIIPTLARQVQVKIYQKAAHGLYLTHADQLLEDILAFVFGVRR